MDSSKVWYFFLDSEALLLWECQDLFFELKSNSHLSGCRKASTRQRWGFIDQLL